MNKLNAVIFDLDGVICFTDKYHFQAYLSVSVMSNLSPLAYR